MKLHLTEDELKWLHYNITNLLPIATKHKEEDRGKSMRTLSKMKYKFTPNATLVNLTTKERELLFLILQHRLVGLESRGSLSEETPFIKSLSQKIKGENK